jgi:hypothetical protein
MCTPYTGMIKLRDHALNLAEKARIDVREITEKHGKLRMYVCLYLYLHVDNFLVIFIIIYVYECIHSIHIYDYDIDVTGYN